MSISFLAIQGSFGPVEIALFKGNICVEQIIEHGAKASSHLIPLVNDILEKNKMSLKDVAFIVTDKGPGAFTTLRVTIATLNGIAFAAQTPLIGIDGLEALALQALEVQVVKKNKPSYLVALLNAYSNDVYAFVSEVDYFNDMSRLGKRIFYGCSNIADLLQKNFMVDKKDTLFFTGNGALLHADLIKEKFSTRAIFEENPTLQASASIIGSLGLADFSAQKNMTQKIIPNYLKSQLFAVKK